MKKPTQNFRLRACIVAISIIYALSAAPLYAQEKGAAGSGKGNVPTDINAASMRYIDSNQTVVFEGGVHVKRPDFELWAEKITLYFNKKAKPKEASNTEPQEALANAETNEGASATPPPSTPGMQMQTGSIDRIVAERGVRIVKDDKVGTCQLGTYYVRSGVLVMEGNPVIKDGKNNSILGKTIKFYINENRSEVLGGVKATFSSQPDNNNFLKGGSGQGKNR